MPVSRRTVLKAGGTIGATVASLSLLEQVAWKPLRGTAEAATLPDIQFDIGNFSAPALNIDDGAGPVTARFGPVYTVFLTAVLRVVPNHSAQPVLASGLNTIEAAYPFSPSGIFTFISYGVPYFNRLPASLVAAAIPRLNDGSGRFALERATPSPTDVVAGNGITKRKFNVPTVIARILDPLRAEWYEKQGVNTICPTRVAIEMLEKEVLEAAGKAS